MPESNQKLGKKEISKILNKYFGYYPNSKEIIFYEIRGYPCKERDFTQSDAYDIAQEHTRQFPDDSRPRFKIRTSLLDKSPRKPPAKRPERPKIEVCSRETVADGVGIARVREAVKSMSYSSYVARRENQSTQEYVKKQLEGVRNWHIKNKIQMPNEIINLFKKYGIDYR